jgi:hypothetical protein
MGITEHTEVEIGDELPDPIIFFPKIMRKELSIDLKKTPM